MVREGGGREEEDGEENDEEEDWEIIDNLYLIFIYSQIKCYNDKN